VKVRVCRVDDIPKLGARRYRHGDGVAIAIFRADGDRVFALRDSCPHKGGPLSQGLVFGASVACPLHNWCIDLASGTAGAPDEGRVERFAVEVTDGEVSLEIAPDGACGATT
jgi:nitrite reductase (NADH) small subunit